MLKTGSLGLIFGLLVLSLTSQTACGKTCDKIQHYVVNSSSSLFDLAASIEGLNCSVITVPLNHFILSRVLTFRGLFNLTLIGQPSLTEVSCEGNGGLKFVDCQLIHLDSFMYTGCSVNDTAKHLNPDYNFTDQAAVYFNSSEDIWISNCFFMGNPATGLILYNVVGNVLISLTNFTGSKPRNDRLRASTNMTYGGMIISRDVGLEEANYTINRCVFGSNENFHPMLGGGMTVILGARGSNNSITITECIFVDNRAIQGGGLYLNMATDCRLLSSVSVKSSTFLSNMATAEGGGMRVLNYAIKETLRVYLHHCVFDTNFAQYGGGLEGYISPRNTEVFKLGKLEITANSCNWTGNGARASGFAVGLYQDVMITYGPLYVLQATFLDCWIFNNSLDNFNMSLLRGSMIGAVYAHGARFYFEGETEISHNYGSGLYLREHAKAVFGVGRIVFSNNRATRGGAITLKSSSVMTLANDTQVIFSFNSALVKGGAIYADVQEGDPCLFDFVGSTTKPASSSLLFVDNYINSFKGDQSIYVYGNNPEKCINEEDNTSYLLYTPFKFVTNSSTSVLFDADTVILDCPAAQTKPCGKATIRVMLGESFSLQPVVLDRFHHETTSFAYLSLYYNGADDVHCIKDWNYTLVGPSLIGLDSYTKNDLLHIQGDRVEDNRQLRLEVFFDKNEAGYRDGYTELIIDLIPCRLGFLYNPASGVCECFTRDNQGDMFCPNNSTACVRSGYWFGETHNNKTSQNDDFNYETFLCDKVACDYTKCCPTQVCPNAPDFCLLQEDKDDLCFSGRGGILCSKCQEDHAFTFSSYKCVPDKTCTGRNSALLLLGVLLYWLAMICFFFIVLSLDLSAGTGFASGIIYYFSVVFVLTDSVVTSPVLTIPLSLSVAVTQLSARVFGHLQYCFFKSWDANLHHQVFLLSSPVFVVVVLLAIIWFSRHCNCPKRLSLAENSPNHAICMLILTSYTSITYTCFRILRPIHMRDGIYVYIDPDIPYFHPSRHLPYALVAILIEVFVSLPICFLLLFAPCLSRLSRVNLVKLRLKPVVDEFQACYKGQHRWYAGFYFLSRQLMYLASSLPYAMLPQSNSLIQCVCVLVLLVQATVQPYKKEFWFLNIVDTFLLTDILLLSLIPIDSNIATSLPPYVKFIQEISPYVLILLPTIYVFGIIFLLLLRHFRRLWKRCRGKQHLEESIVDSTSYASGNMEKEREEESKYIEGDPFTGSFFKDPGEREPLLRDSQSFSSSSVAVTGRRRGRHHTEPATSSSFRVSSLRSFPPNSARGCNEKAATS